MTLLAEIERYLRNTGMAPATFGKTVTGDHKLVDRLRGGAQPRHATIEKVRTWIEAHPRGNRVQPAPQPHGLAHARMSAAVPTGSGVAADVSAEARAAGQRRRLARSSGSVARPVPAGPIMRTPAEQIASSMLEQPGDVIAYVKRQWPILWDRLLRVARRDGASPASMLFAIIELGLAHAGGEER